MRRPSPSMIVSSLALVVALGGTSYAATQIGTANIKNNAVTSAKIKNGTVDSRDIKNGSIKGADLGFTAPAGPAGADGAAGPAGPAGSDGAGRWALVDPTGAIVAQSGGFAVVAGYPTLPNTAVAPAPDNSLRANGNVYINAGEDLSNNGIVASIALQNTVDLNGDAVTSGRAPGADANPEFSGEISTSRCAFTGSTGIATNCAPAAAQNTTSFVVSPRNSDGSVTINNARKWFYVIITGDSSELPAS